MQELQKLIHSIVQMGDEPDLLPPSKTDLLLYAPCPVKLAVKDQVDRIAEEMQGRRRGSLNPRPHGLHIHRPIRPTIPANGLRPASGNHRLYRFWGLLEARVRRAVRSSRGVRGGASTCNQPHDRTGRDDRPPRVLYHLRRNPLHLPGGFQPPRAPSRAPHLGRFARSALPGGNRLVRRRR